MNKKIIALALVIIFTSISPWVSYGDNEFDEKLEESILKVKDLFEISAEYDKFQSNINSYNNEVKFNLSWTDTKEKLSPLNITIDLDGNIVSYDNYPNNYQDFKNKLPKYSREQAKEIALNFINKVSPDIKSIKTSDDNYTDNLHDDNYYFKYTRFINDIEYKANNLDLVVNKYTGEVVSYFVNWERQVEFPAPNAIIDREKAKEKFKEKIGLKLVYKMKRDYYRPIDVQNDKDKETYYIAYSVLDTNQAIDAFTGEKILVNSYGIYADGMGGDKEAAAEDSGISPEERAEIDKLKNILIGKQAEEKARQILNLDKNFKLESQNLYKNYKNPADYNWDMYFVNNDKASKYSNISIGIDAKSGNLLNFYKYKDYNEKQKNTINKDQALKLAKDYLNKQNPNEKDKVELMENYYAYIDPNQEPMTYDFQFIRKENDIYVENDAIYIGVDGANGEIISYSFDWYKGKLPSKENIISMEQAYEIMWEKIGIELAYVKVLNNNIEPRPEESLDTTKLIIDNGEKSIIKLVYQLNPDKPAIIDANSGEILDYSGRPYIAKESINYSDIDDSYAKDKIAMLAKYGIGFKEDKFLPKQEIKQSEYLYLLWRSINQFRTDLPSEDEIYNDFIKSGYIKETEKDPDKIVSKLESVKYIIRIMQLTEVAEIEGIYEDIFKDSKDIDKSEKGYINIAYGLKIINGNGTGQINPNYPLKRQDAANILYNYLFR